jgi:CspA family cold shock protein
MRQTGTIKFCKQKTPESPVGFCFIAPETGGKDVYLTEDAVERSGLKYPLADNTRVTFSIEEDRRGRGPQAVDIQLA